MELLLSLVALSLRGAGLRFGFGFTACCISHLALGTCFLPMDLGEQGCAGNTSVSICGCVWEGLLGEFHIFNHCHSVKALPATDSLSKHLIPFIYSPELLGLSSSILGRVQ